MKIHEEFVLSCIYCRKKLASVLVVESNEERIGNNKKSLSCSFMLNECGQCNKKNNVESKIFHGTTVIQSLENNEIILEDTILKKGVVKNIISTKIK